MRLAVFHHVSLNLTISIDISYMSMIIAARHSLFLCSHSSFSLNQNQNQNQNGIYCQVGLHLLGIFSGVKVHTVNIKHKNIENTISTTHNIKSQISTTHKKSTTHRNQKTQYIRYKYINNEYKKKWKVECKKQNRSAMWMSNVQCNVCYCNTDLGCGGGIRVQVRWGSRALLIRTEGHTKEQAHTYIQRGSMHTIHLLLASQ